MITAQLPAAAPLRSARPATHPSCLDSGDRVTLGESFPPLPRLSALKLQAPAPAWELINVPGECVNVEEKLIPGKTNIVYFSAEWCPYCQRMAPRLEELVGRDTDYVVRKVDIREFKSPVWNQYELHKTGVPAFRIYDGEGEMLAEGKAARARLEEVLIPPPPRA